jgi:hypothetical protein
VKKKIMQFLWFLLVGPMTLKKQRGCRFSFFWPNHRTDLVFKTMVHIGLDVDAKLNFILDFFLVSVLLPFTSS